MDLREIRGALRLLRYQTDLSLDDIPGLDRSTVHRIENVKGNPDYSPTLESVARIVEACGYTLGDFFNKLEDVSKHVSAQPKPNVLESLQDEENVRQVQAFLELPEDARRALMTLALTLTRNTSEPD